jgi:hypothetical protein
MDPVRFGIYTTIGCIPWTAALAWAGYAVGAQWQSVAAGFRGPTYVIAAVVIVGLAAGLWGYLRRQRSGKSRAARAGRLDGPGAVRHQARPNGDLVVMSSAADGPARRAKQHQDQAHDQCNDADRPQDRDTQHEPENQQDDA